MKRPDFHIELGGPCNNHCVNCPKPKDMRISLDSLEKNLDLAMAAGERAVFFPHREWVLHPLRREIIRALQSRKLAFGIATNARAFSNRRVLRNLKTVGLAYAEVLLHAGSPYPYYLITETEGFFQALDGIRNILLEGLDCRVVMPVNRYNKGGLRRAVLAMEAMPRVVDLEFMDPSGRFSRHIEEALDHRRRLRGEVRVTVPADVRMLPVQNETFTAKEVCARRIQEGSGTLDLFVRTADHHYQRYRLSDPLPWATLLRARNVRSLVFDGAGRRFRLEKTCAACPRLLCCSGRFGIDEREEEEEPGRSDLKDLEARARRVIDLSEERSRPALLELRRMMASLPEGEPLLVRGRVPRLVMGNDSPEPETIEDLDVEWVADLAGMFGLSVDAYVLPGGRSRNRFGILLRKEAEKRTVVMERTAVFSVSSACVADCVMCSMPKIYAGETIDGQRIPPVMEELKLCGFTAVDIFGGEITLREDLPELIRFAKTMNLNTMVITTGYKVDDAYLSLLEEAGLDKIEVALDAPTAELHDRIKGRKGLFEHAVRAVKAVGEQERLYVEVNTVILRDNVAELPALHRFVARELGGRRHRFFYFVHVPTSLTRPRWMTESQSTAYIREIRPELLRLSRELGTKLDFCPDIDPADYGTEEAFIRRMRYGLYQDRGVCQAPGRDLLIMPDGAVYGCISPVVAHSGREIGRIGEGDLLEFLRGEKMEIWRKEAGTWPECRSCISRR